MNDSPSPAREWHVGMAVTPAHLAALGLFGRIHVIRELLPDGSLRCEYYAPGGVRTMTISPAKDWIEA